MSFLPSFLLSLELFTILKPEQPPAWGIMQTVAPQDWMRIESSCIGEDDTIQKAGSRLILTKAQTEIAVSAGSLTAGGIISELKSPLSSVVSASQTGNFTSLAPSITVPQSAGASTSTMVAMELTTPAGNLFFLQQEDDTRAAGGGLNLESGGVLLHLAAAGYRETLPEHHARDWFSLHPYNPEEELTTLLGTAQLQAQGNSGNTVALEEAAGCSAVTPETSPTRWFNRTGMVLSCLDDTLVVHGGCYVGDLDYRKINGDRLRETVRVGGGIRWKSPAGTAAGLAATWTLHTPEELQGIPFWQKNVTLQLGNSTVTYTQDSPERKDTTLTVSGSIAVDEAGISFSAYGPVQYASLQEIANGTISFRIRSRTGIRAEVSATFKEAEQTKLAGELSVTTGPLRHLLKGSYSPRDREAACSCTISAKWK